MFPPLPSQFVWLMISKNDKIIHEILRILNEKSAEEIALTKLIGAIQKLEKNPKTKGDQIHKSDLTNNPSNKKDDNPK